MPVATIHPLLRHVRRLAGISPDEPSSDGQLLARFQADREESAFAALMRRHGQLVWNVCRRVLNHEQDAEDAFQATFLVLARNVGSIQKREALANWLYGVAFRTSMK